jgi:hypothetical protein
MDTELSVEAKNHYVALLCKIMSPIMVETFVNMYKEAIERGKGNRDATQKNFKILLEEITNWNNSIISTHATEYTNSCPYFSDLLAAVFVCFIKILSSVRLTKDSKKINVKLPSNDNFVHACINNAGQDFITKMGIFREQDPSTRNMLIKEVCKLAIIETLHDLIPVPVILRTYMNPDMSEVEIGEIQEPEPEPEPEPEAEPEPEQDPEQLPAPLPLQQPVQQQEVKTIPLQSVDHAPTLFEDAPTQVQKQPQQI